MISIVDKLLNPSLLWWYFGFS